MEVHRIGDISRGVLLLSVAFARVSHSKIHRAYLSFRWTLSHKEPKVNTEKILMIIKDDCLYVGIAV
jgi:hypothetical protein